MRGFCYLIAVAALAFCNSAFADYLGPGRELDVGQYFYSSNASYYVIMQADGNLVVYRNDGSGHAVWSSNTTGLGGVRAAMQADGNFVIYTAAGRAVWQTASNGPDRYFTVDDGGLAQVLTTIPTWTSNTSDGTSPAGIAPIIFGRGTLFPKAQMFAQASGKYEFVFQADSDLVLYRNGAAIWSSNTTGLNAEYADFDGLLNLWNEDGIVWQAQRSTNTYGYPKDNVRYEDGYLAYFPDGNLIAYAPVIIWRAPDGDIIGGGQQPHCYGSAPCLPWLIPITFPW
jgi:hypothetical protein